MSMYKGIKSFDREQLIFVVEAAMATVFDKIQSSLPPCITLGEYHQYRSKIDQYIFGAKETIGLLVPVLWAQLNQPEGMGTNDFIGWKEFDELVSCFCEKTIENPNWEDAVKGVDCRPLAEKIVDSNFQEYLAKPAKCIGWYAIHKQTQFALFNTNNLPYESYDSCKENIQKFVESNILWQDNGNFSIIHVYEDGKLGFEDYESDSQS